MEVKQFTDVTIDGKVYRLGGYESEGYLQQVAAYVNRKIEELKEQNAYARQPEDVQNVLIFLNLADDYFRKNAENEELKKQLDRKEQEVYALKHDLVAARLRMEQTE